MCLRSLSLPKARILLREEDPHTRQALRNLLFDAGYAISDVAKAETAVGQIDLILVSVRERRETQATMDLSDPAVPVIALVDHATWTGFDFLDAANALGAVAVLQRPFSRATLLQLMAQILSNTSAKAVAAKNDIADEVDPADLLLV